MKSKILLLLLITPFCSFSQKNSTDEKIILPLDSVTNLISYKGVVELGTGSKDQLYVTAREWFARNFKSAQSVLQMDDRTSGKLIGKAYSTGVYKYMVTIPFELHYTIIISVKDGKYRYEITSLYVKHQQLDAVDIEEINKVYLNKGRGYAAYKKIIPVVDLNVRSLVLSLTDFMKNTDIKTSVTDDNF